MSTELTRDEQEIRELVAERAAAMREKDAKRVVSQFAPGAVTFTLAPPLRQADTDAHDVEARQRWFDGFEDEMGYDVRDLEVTVGGEVAFAHALTCLTASPKGSPEGFELWFRSTLGLRRVGGAWRIAHLHDSTPFYMDGSFRAAVDLTPR